MKMRCITYLSFCLLLLCSCNQDQAALDAYHEALSLMEQGDAPAALEKFEQTAEMTNKDSLLALCYSKMGTLYFSQRLLDRALASYRQAYEVDLRARDTLGLIYDLRDIGNVHRASEPDDSCIIYFQRARELAITTGDIPMQRDVESQMAAWHLYHNHLDETRRWLMPVLEYTDSGNRSAFNFMLADLYQCEGKRDSATYYYMQLLEVGNVFTQQAAHRHLAEYALSDGDAKTALEHLVRYEALTDSVHKGNDAEGLRHVAALYDYSHQQQKTARSQRNTIVASAISVILLLLLLVCWIYWSRRRRMFHLRIEQLELLLENHQQKEAIAPDDRRNIIQKTNIYRRIQRLIDNNVPTPLFDEDWHQLEDTVNSVYPDFIHRIADFCRLNVQERRVCLLLKLGITPVNIAKLTAHSKQSVTNTRTRLFEKAFGRKGSATEWDEFIETL